jgi:hypothetical protein
MTVNRRSELERLLDLTVLGPTHPQLGTCWQFTGTCTPYGRIAKAQDSYAHPARVEAPARPDPRRRNGPSASGNAPAEPSRPSPIGFVMLTPPLAAALPQSRRLACGPAGVCRQPCR